MKNQTRQENLTYLALWGMLFAAPMLSMLVRTAADTTATFRWDELWMVWRHFALYFIIFVVHNVFLAPLLVYQHRKLLYGSAVAVVVAAFTLYQCSQHPDRPDGIGSRPPHELRVQHEGPPLEGDAHPDDRHPGDADFDTPPPREPHGARPHDARFDEHRPPAFIGQGDVIACIVLVLMLGMNIAIKGFYKTRHDQEKLVALEKKNLEQQLEYLKYQINPHFFMNTLNNIHALVDIDAERAKETILELSRMMRFILYEGDKSGVPLTREFEFINNYITLMRLRYTDKVKISVSLPHEAPDRTVPPLMLISFIENAFKHGISYQHPSFIDIHIGIEGQKLRFRCVNSKADKPTQEKGGVGLANVKQRLHLLYDNNFTLNIQDNPETYHVELDIPLLQPESRKSQIVNRNNP